MAKKKAMPNKDTPKKGKAKAMLDMKAVMMEKMKGKC